MVLSHSCRHVSLTIILPITSIIIVVVVVIVVVIAILLIAIIVIMFNNKLYTLICDIQFSC